MAIGIDLGTSSIKMAEVRRIFGKPRLAGLSRKRIAHYKPAELKQVVPKLLRDALSGRERGKRAVLGVTGRDVNLQLVVYPASKLSNYTYLLEQEVQAARTEAPDLYIDYATLRKPDAYFPKFLAIVGRGKSALIDERLEEAAASGFKTADIVPAPFALFAAYANAYPQEGGVVMLLNIGQDNMDIALVRGGKLLFGRNVSQGARGFDDQIRALARVSDDESEALKIRYGRLAADGTEPRTAELLPAIRQAAYTLAGVIQSSIAYARNQLGEKDLPVDKVYLSGGGAKLSGLEAYLQSALKIPVEFLDPYKGLDVSMIAAAGEEEPLAIPTDMAVAVGLSLIGVSPSKYSHLSLLPDRVRTRKQWFRTVPLLAAGAAALALSMLVGTIMMTVRAGEDESAAKEMSERITSLRGNVSKVDELEKQFRSLFARNDVLASYTVHGRGLLDVYSKLRNLAVDGLVIQKLELTEPMDEKKTADVKKVVANVAGHGHILGEWKSDDDQGIKMKDGTSVPMKDARVWAVVRRSLLISGEIDEQIKGGAHETLVLLTRQLSDSATGTTCEIYTQNTSPDKPGWHVFQLMVHFP